MLFKIEIKFQYSIEIRAYRYLLFRGDKIEQLINKAIVSICSFWYVLGKADKSAMYENNDVINIM